MYRKIEPLLRVSYNKASELYPNEYILMRLDCTNMSTDIGTVLYVGNDEGELFSLVTKLNDPMCCVFEGLNLQCSLGGLVASA